MNGGDERYHIKLSLGLLARNLLVEEYPLAESYLTEADGRWILDTEVANYTGVTRFVVGLLDDIRIIDSPDLEAHIARYVEHFWPQAIREER